MNVNFLNWVVAIRKYIKNGRNRKFCFTFLNLFVMTTDTLCCISSTSYVTPVYSYTRNASKGHPRKKESFVLIVFIWRKLKSNSFSGLSKGGLLNWFFFKTGNRYDCFRQIMYWHKLINIVQWKFWVFDLLP